MIFSTFSILTMAAPPSGGQGGGGNLFSSFLPLIVIFVIFYFLMIRPQQKQQKKHREMLGNLKKGDAVFTSSGIFGTIFSINDTSIVLEVANDVRIKFSRTAIAGVVNNQNA